MRHWNAIADTLHSGEVFLPLLLEDENGISHANDWAKGFLCGMELRRTDWAVLLDDEKHGGRLVPILALAHEHHPDPEMRPYKGAISTEEREKLIVGAAAGVTGFAVTSKHSEWLKGSRLIALQPSVARHQRLGATIRVHVDQERNSSSAVEELHSIKVASVLNPQHTLDIFPGVSPTSNEPDWHSRRVAKLQCWTVSNTHRRVS
jgi:hypothetical protein